MTRLPELNPDSLNPQHQKLVEKIVERRGGSLGPYAVLLRIPALAEKMAGLGDYFREQSVLSGADRELAILVAAREVGSGYEWTRHESIARNAGARVAAIEAVRNMIYTGLSEHELVIIEVVQSLFRTKLVPPALFDKALSQLGEDRLVELITLAGFYCSISFLVSAFEISMPEGTQQPF